MTAENFVYWFNGFLEIQNPEFITKDQIKEIRNHINLVLKKTTLPIGGEINIQYNKDFMPKWPPGPPASC